MCYEPKNIRDYISSNERTRENRRWTNLLEDIKNNFRELEELSVLGDLSEQELFFKYKEVVSNKNDLDSVKRFNSLIRKHYPSPEFDWIRFCGAFIN